MVLLLRFSNVVEVFRKGEDLVRRLRTVGNHTDEVTV